MIAYFKQFVNNKMYLGLISANFLLVVALIIFSNTGILPLRLSDFIFFATLVFLFALYRPGWAFLFFVGTIALENINLAPEELGISLRPFQLIGVLTFLAAFCRFLVKRLNFRMPKFSRLDFTLIIFLFGSFLSSLASSEKMASLKISIILFSFLILYLLVRIFVQSMEDLKKIIPFFLSSALIVSLYGIWQNIQFKLGANSFAVMPGRPNATFTEPDWLGIYITLCVAVILSMIYFFRSKSKNEAAQIPNSKLQISNKYSIRQLADKIQNLFIFLSLVTFFLSLILTVSRSAWLGAFAIFVIYATIVFTNLKFSPKHWRLKETAWQKFFIISALAVAIILVYLFNLTTFNIFQRFQSTGGNQTITISCNNEEGWQKIKKLKQIEHLEQLEQFGCRHINLEKIENEKTNNKFVAEILRPDPNVNIRKIIYQKSWQEIKANPILGIGWGAIGKTLGTDERGANLNSSNIFLEVWLGAGIVGLLTFIGFWIIILIRAIKNFHQDDISSKAFGIFLILGIIALLIPNLFNAGILLGILWLFWGITLVK